MELALFHMLQCIAVRECLIFCLKQGDGFQIPGIRMGGHRFQMLVIVQWIGKLSSCCLRTLKLILTHGMDDAGRTPLSYAAEEGNIYCIIDLIQDGRIDLDSRDNEGRMPLLYAIMRSQIGAVSLLLRTGKVSIAYIDRCGLSPMDYARRYKHPGILGLLYCLTA